MQQGGHDFYRDRRVLITGGLGFLGSNLTLALRQAGAQVTVVDSLVPGCGSNASNLEGAGIRVERCDIGDESAMERLLPGAEVIFNLAGEISHTRSVTHPERDLDLNVRSQLRFLMCCRRLAPRARVIFASSRQIYGAPRYLPVDEKHPVRPTDFNGVHKWAAETYHRILSVTDDMETVCLRLTNTYGPRQALNLPWQGFIGTFLSRALRGLPVEVYGDGRQLRDMLYVADAVEAFLGCGEQSLEAGSPHAVFNVGGPEPVPLARIAEAVVEAARPTRSEVAYIEFPPSRRKIDIGDYYADNHAIGSWTGWSPHVGFAEGIRETVEFYRQRAGDYPLEPADSSL